MESSANPMQSSFATGKGGSDGPCMMEEMYIESI
jgi:hypothetical protein